MNDLHAIKPARSVAFTCQGVDVLFDDDRLVSLTGMWKAANSPENKLQRDWDRLPDAVNFIASLTKNLNVSKSHILKSRRGKHLSGTFAHWQVALAYGKYLNPKFHQFVNQAFKEWTEEKLNPSLKIKWGVAAYRKQGRDDGWIADRVEGIVQRNSLTSTMADHNAKRIGADNPFAEANRSISLQLLGKTPGEIKAAAGLPKSARTRDHLDRRSLAAIRFAESEAEHAIKAEGADGNAECCRRAGEAVKTAMAMLDAFQTV